MGARHGHSRHAGELVAIEGIIQDITERKESSQALREAERRYYNLFENAIEGIFRTTLDGQYLDANPALARIYGFESPMELMQIAAATFAVSCTSIRHRRDEFMRADQGARHRQRLRIADLSQERRRDLDFRERARRVRRRRPARLLRRHGRRHHRAQALSGPHRAAGELRHADGARESLAAERAPRSRRFARPRATARGLRSCSSISIDSSTSTTASAITSATSCCARWPSGSRRACATATRSRGWAAMNSCC